MGKHAYLISVHSNPNQLKKLISVLDDSRNDIYIHVDKKAIPLYGALTKNEIVAHGISSNIYFLNKSIDVEWGGYSQILFKLELIKSALINGPYDYYHHISGQDFPIKTQDYIHDFFSRNQGKNFVSFEENTGFDYSYRIKYYYDFLKGMKRPSSKLDKAKIVAYASLQHLLFGIDRTKKVENILIKKGGAWFSITDEFAKYVIDMEQWIDSIFNATYCADEMFLQTILWNSEFKHSLFCPSNGENTTMRLIDWKRGHPYVFKEKDYKELMSSRCLWARKFDTSIDEIIIDKLAYSLSH